MKKNIPLYKQIEESFIQQIEHGQLKKGDRIPSETEIVSQFHVSQITAKNALNNLAEKGYVKRIRGKGTFVDFENVEKKERIIGFIFTTMKTSIDRQLLSHLEAFARKEKLRFFFGLSRESMEEEINLIHYFIECGVEGLIIFPTESENYNEDILRLHLEKFPLVLVDRYFNKLGITSVTSDNFSAGFKLADMVIQKRFKKFAFITTVEENSATIDRTKGIECAYVKNQIPIDKNLWLFVPSTIESNESLIAFLEKNKPDVVITVNAHLSKLIHDYTETNNIFHLSFDNPAGCNYYIEQDVEEISRLVIANLKKLLNDETCDPTLTFVPTMLSKGSLS
ncbi:GntR family transcriptional regulator [Candidatus Enterococcus murrayae]|uniref:GntR family transcriptional regulator n=1 Tax=Candidatus Enterococcus murrayae TaxID=2815321 RepID=A0ABS3HGP7_9ENTE|nr:GntR family transcriptional regulator [Enterococcus sp. MJM16]MBO0452599.1 GntR family transcriptional regulator [Enterococcus sp. MJM16]